MVVAAVAVLASLAVCWTWRGIRDKWRRLGAFGKFAAIAVFCALVWRGGAKNGGEDCPVVARQSRHDGRRRCVDEGERGQQGLERLRDCEESKVRVLQEKVERTDI